MYNIFYSLIIRFLCDCYQLQACQRKLDSKCEALLILSRDLDQCRQERDQFQLMAEQVQSRYQSIKRQLAGIVSLETFQIINGFHNTKLPNSLLAGMCVVRTGCR